MLSLVLGFFFFGEDSIGTAAAVFVFFAFFSFFSFSFFSFFAFFVFSLFVFFTFFALGLMESSLLVHTAIHLGCRE